MLLLLSCSKETSEDNLDIKEGIGTIWLSGGLAFCAEQIRMENGDTLIPTNTSLTISFDSGQKVNLKYSELNSRDSGCSIGRDCKIIEITVIE